MLFFNSIFSISTLIVLVSVITLTFPNLISAGHGSGSSYGAHAGQEAVNELNSNQGVSAWAAQNAVAAAVGRDYQNQLGTTAQFVAAFTSPVTKQQAAEAFSAVQHQQQGSYISAALASNAPAISYAANHAAKNNFAQAYQAAQGGTLHALAEDAAAQQMAHLAGSSLASQQLQSAHYAQQASAAKTTQTATNAAALQAINGVNGVDRAASYSFTGGAGGGGSSGGYGSGGGGGGGGGSGGYGGGGGGGGY